MVRSGVTRDTVVNELHLDGAEVRAAVQPERDPRSVIGDPHRERQLTVTAALRLLGMLLLLASAGSAPAQDSVAQFYKGKTITIIVSSSPGGGYDLYGRMIARQVVALLSNL